jgi:hypothetical protein
MSVKQRPAMNGRRAVTSPRRPTLPPPRPLGDWTSPTGNRVTVWTEPLPGGGPHDLAVRFSWANRLPPPERYREDYRFWLALCSEISCRLCEQQELPTADLMFAVSDHNLNLTLRYTPGAEHPEIEPTHTDWLLPSGFSWRPDPMTFTDETP